LLANALILLTGCGSGGPPRYRLSGRATKGGQPIPAGSITLVPDVGKGNQGPAVSVAIKDGQYDTDLQDTGHVGGPHIVKITGMDGTVSPEFPMGLPLFPEYEMSVDLPTQAAQQNFEVPADWVMPRTAPVTDHGA
jgi:hypothetical protein